jgi:hypothetical protein
MASTCFLVALDHLVLHREVVRRVDRAFLGHQVAHVAVGGQHLEVLAEVLLDGLRLGRRLHDNEIAAQSRLMQRVRALFEDQVFHLSVSGFLARLAEQHHQNDPFDLFDVDFIGLERHQAVDDQFALST